MQNLLGNNSGFYWVLVEKVVAEENPWAEPWKQSDRSKAYKLDKDHQDDNHQREMILQLLWPSKNKNRD